MTNPCCCVGDTPCGDLPCFDSKECEGIFCDAAPHQCPWGADVLYAGLVAHFAVGVHVNMQQIPMRLAIPFEPFSWGCWDADETQTCCGNFNTCMSDEGNCENYAAVKMRVDCFADFDSNQIGNTEFRAIQFPPNQFLTNCRWCGAYGNGYYTNGLPTVDQLWPRCFDCASRVPGACTFTGTPMPDIGFIDGNNQLNEYTPNLVIREPADNGTLCCDVVGFQCTEPSSERRARYYVTGILGGNPYEMTTYPGTPHPCENPDHRDVYMAKELWLLPNPQGSGNCIRILLRVRMYHWYQARLPGIGYADPSFPPACSCNDPGVSYVGMGCQPIGTHQPHLTTGEAWYYLDLQGDETLPDALAKPLRLFWVDQSMPCPGTPVFCTHEAAGVVTNNYTGCECLFPEDSDSCTDVQEDPCYYDASVEVCTDYSAPEYGPQEVPCSTTDNGVFPTEVPNTHFTFPERVYLT